jgi:hypothetical protein
MPHLPLLCHPASACPHIDRFTAQLSTQDVRWLLQFRLQGDIDALTLPAPTTPRRTDGLWQHTCFEAFVRAAAATEAYYEFNFSPSGEWAAYRFDAYRHGMTPLAMDAPRMDVRRHGEHLDVDVEWLPSPDLRRPQPNRVASLTAVIEDRDASLSYWALRHAAQKPDFHHRDSFVLQLPAAPAAV